jgi:diaminopimelate decarboxylase
MSARPDLPGAPHLRYAQGELMLESCRLDDLARRFGTPLYVYSQAAIRDAVQAYQAALSAQPHLLCYAVKANSNLAILKLMSDLGCGFDIVSGGELDRVLAAGASAQRVVFSGVGKTCAEMAQALRAGVQCFNVESEAELHVLSQVAQTEELVARISLRVNPDVDAKTHPYISTGLKSNKFGIPHEQAERLYVLAASLPGIEVAGIDCHIGSQITDTAPYLDALERVLDLVEAIEKHGLTLHHLDIGGGLGIRYVDERPPTPGELLAQVLQHLRERGHAQRKLLLEPGRSLVGNAGVLLSEVLYLKPAVGEDGKHFCVIDAGMNDLMRPTLYDAYMQIVPCTPRPGTTQHWEVVGPVCETGDWLGHERALNVAAGDYLAVLSAGAYGMSMASHYNTRGKPAEVLVAGAQARLIRRRESPGDLYAAEQGLD